jgi:hypothetical protein
VVVALNVAEAKYSAALNVSAVVAARIGATPKLWVPVRISPLNEVHIACVFGMTFPLYDVCGYAVSEHVLFQVDVDRAVNQLTFQPVFHPLGKLLLIIDCTLTFFK